MATGWIISHKNLNDVAKLKASLIGVFIVCLRESGREGKQGNIALLFCNCWTVGGHFEF